MPCAHRYISLICGVAIFMLSLQAGSADAPPPLPKHLKSHISIRSPKRLLESLDAFVAKATADTGRPIPRGFVSMLAQMNLALPENAWNAEGEVHLLSPEAPSGEYPMVAVLEVGNMDAFVAALATKGVTATPQTPAPDAYNSVYSLAIPGRGNSVIVEVSDSRVAMADALTTIDRIFMPLKDGDWEMTHFGDAAVRATIAIPRRDNPMLPVLEEIGAHRREVLNEITAAKINAGVAGGLIDAVQAGLPVLGEEMIKLRDIAVELDVEPAFIRLGVGLGSEPGAFLQQIAAAIDDRDAVRSELAESIDAEALTLTVIAPVAEIIPDAAQNLKRIAGGLMAAALPAQKEAAEKLIDGFVTLNTLPSAIGMYNNPKRRYDMALLGTDDPKALAGVCRAMVDFLNATLPLVVEDSSYHLSLKAEAGLDDPARGLVRYRLAFADEKKMGALLAFLASETPSFTMDMEDLREAILQIEERDGAVAVLFGMADEMNLAADGRETSSRSQPMPAAASVKQAMERIDNAQAAMTLMDGDHLFVTVATTLIKRLGDPHLPESQNPYLTMFNQALPGLRKSGETAAIGYGVKDGGLSFQIAIPVEVVTTAVLSMEAFQRAAQQPARGSR